MQQHQSPGIPVVRLLLATCELLQRKQRWAGIRTRLLMHAPNEQLLLSGSPADAANE